MSDNTDLSKVLEVMSILYNFNRAGSVIANVAREAIDDICTLLRDNAASDFPDPERLRQLLGWLQIIDALEKMQL